MTTPLSNQIIREITPLSDKDCFYIAERYKTEFTYPIHNHSEFELNFTEKAAGVRRIVGDSSEVIGDYDLVLITGKDLEHVWEQNDCHSKEIREITIQFSSDLFFKSFSLGFLALFILRANPWHSFSAAIGAVLVPQILFFPLLVAAASLMFQMSLLIFYLNKQELLKEILAKSAIMLIILLICALVSLISSGLVIKLF